MPEINYAAEMTLPDGKTCADCVHVKRCTAFGFSGPTETSCDFWPSRFRLPRYVPPVVTPVGNMNDLLARVDVCGDD